MSWKLCIPFARTCRSYLHFLYLLFVLEVIPRRKPTMGPLPSWYDFKHEQKVYRVRQRICKYEQKDTHARLSFPPSKDLPPTGLVQTLKTVIFFQIKGNSWLFELTVPPQWFSNPSLLPHAPPPATTGVGVQT